MKLTFSQLLKSRVVWAAVATAAVNVWNTSSHELPDNVVQIGNVLAALLIAAFRKSPTQQPAALQDAANFAKATGIK